MAKKKDTLVEEEVKIKADLDKSKKKILDSTSTKKVAKKDDAKPAKKVAKKDNAKPIKKSEEKPVKVKKLTKKELEEAKRIAELTLEEE